tara:strand:- start:38 stop:1249 length:1212 start_codon:yes stop_codon:yes gene_type:complete
MGSLHHELHFQLKKEYYYNKCLISAKYSKSKVTICNDENLENNGVFTTHDGCLSEPNTIVRYFGRQCEAQNMMGQRFFSKSLVDNWLDWCVTALEPVVTLWVFTLLGYLPPNPKNIEKAKTQIVPLLHKLETHLLNNSFLVDNNITVADIVICSALVFPMKMVFDAEYRKEYPCISRWFLTCIGQTEFHSVLGDIALCKEVKTLPKKEKKKKKNKSEKQAAQKQPHQTKPKKQRLKHPLDTLPKSEFSLDAWKKKYSNSKTLDVLHESFNEWFITNFDKEGFSIWETYKLENEDPSAPENIKDDDWKCSNAVGGLVSRYDEIRKWSFGVFHILDNFEKYGRHVIRGLMIIRGQEQKYFSCNPEYNLYSWDKLDIDNDKSKIKDIICGWDNCGAEPIFDSKVFK